MDSRIFGHLKSLRFSVRTLLTVVAVIAGILAVSVWFYQSSAPYRLIQRAYEGDLHAVRGLLSQGTRVNARDRWDGTPLMYASSQGHLEIVKELLRAGAPINERARSNKTPLMFAAQAGHLAIVEYLISQGADTQLVNNKGKTATQLAEESGHKEVETYLKNHSRKNP